MARRIASVEVLPGIILKVRDNKGREHVYVVEVDSTAEIREMAEKLKDAVWSGALHRYEHRILSGRVR